jgi:hypothetical protein
LRVHGATSWGWLSPRGRILARTGLGVLSWVIAPELVDEAVGDGLAWEMRLRALPSRLGVYFILGLCLYSSQPYAQVLRELTSGLGPALAAAGWQVPASTALTGVRVRIGERPLECLFRRIASACCPGRAPWSHVGGLLVAAWDGTTVDAEDSEANAAEFGKPGARKGSTAFPQLRLVALVACGTRGLLDAAIGPLRGKGTGERELARRLLGSLHQGMLLLADRGFYSYQLWNAAAATGAGLLWRAKDDMHLPVARELPDGSYLAHVRDPRAVQARLHKNGKRRRRGSALPADAGPLPGITVRVIEFILTVTEDDSTARTERYRLVTTLLDWRAFPAAELAAAYSWRWAIETGYRECKTYLHGSGRRLRGRTPELARQELWALLAVYQAIRVIIAWAAAGAGTDPDRISFTAALHTARRTITTARDSMDTALAATEAEILDCLVPQREGRIYPRAAKKPASPYPPRHKKTSPISQHAGYTITIAPASTATHTAPGQQKQPETTANQPP